MFQDRDQHSSTESSLAARVGIPIKGYLVKSSLFWMASLSPSLTTLRHIPNGIYKPIPNTIYIVKYHLRRVQISGHSSVQSSSTLRSRKAYQPIYILKFKKIEQGQLLYPKIFPLMFFQDFLLHRWLKTSRSRN